MAQQLTRSWLQAPAPTVQSLELLQGTSLTNQLQHPHFRHYRRHKALKQYPQELVGIASQHLSQRSKRMIAN